MLVGRVLLFGDLLRRRALDLGHAFGADDLRVGAGEHQRLVPVVQPAHSERRRAAFTYRQDGRAPGVPILAVTLDHQPLVHIRLHRAIPSSVRELEASSWNHPIAAVAPSAGTYVPTSACRMLK